LQEAAMPEFKVDRMVGPVHVGVSVTDDPNGKWVKLDGTYYSYFAFPEWSNKQLNGLAVIVGKYLFSLGWLA